MTKKSTATADSKILRQKGRERLFIKKFYGVTKKSTATADSKILRQKGRERLFIEKFYGVTKKSTATAGLKNSTAKRAGTFVH